MRTEDDVRVQVVVLLFEKGVTFLPPRPAKCFCGAPILLGGKPAGVMAALNTEREYVFEQRGQSPGAAQMQSANRGV
jgi:hypothetical protein